MRTAKMEAGIDMVKRDLVATAQVQFLMLQTISQAVTQTFFQSVSAVITRKR
jgi:hypothetical protein